MGVNFFEGNRKYGKVDDDFTFESLEVLLLSNIEIEMLFKQLHNFTKYILMSLLIVLWCR